MVSCQLMSLSALAKTVILSPQHNTKKKIKKKNIAVILQINCIVVPSFRQDKETNAYIKSYPVMVYFGRVTLQPQR